MPGVAPASHSSGTTPPPTTTAATTPPTPCANPLSTHPRVQALYETWGYEKQDEAEPFDDSPLYAVVVRHINRWKNARDAGPGFLLTRT